VQGQNYILTTNFTLENGLPSNYIYETVEDLDGFLWIATNNGVSRFDGKRFVNYTTRDGLPSNDVLQIKIENNGTLWVNCYKQAPCYFDAKQNKFFSFENIPIIQDLKKTLVSIETNHKSGVFYRCYLGSAFFENKKFKQFNKSDLFTLLVNDKQYYFTNTENKNFDRLIHFYNTNNKKVASNLFQHSEHFTNINAYRNRICFLNEKLLKVIEIKDFKPFQIKVDSIKSEEKIKWFNINNDEIFIFTKLGTINIYDSKTFKLKQTIKDFKDVNNVYKDKKGTIWIATLNGLYKYSITSIKHFNILNNIDLNFLSITVSDKNKIIAGNFQGEVLDNNNIKTIYKKNSEKHTTWVRNVIAFKNSTIAISDYGFSINYDKTKTIVTNKGFMTLLKTAHKLNDSILIIGTNTGLYQLNANSNKWKFLKSPEERILNISKINESKFYFLVSNGIMSYDLLTQKSKLQFSNSQLKNESIAGIFGSTQNSFWFYTVKGNIYFIENNKIVHSIINSSLLPININKVLKVDDKLWMASTEGLYIVDTSNLPKFSVIKHNKSDGLNSNFINDLYLKNDSVYIATSKGISVVSKNLKNKDYDVKPVLISIKVNNKSKPLEKVYHLKNDERNIILDIGGVDLKGHFNTFQFRVDNGKWIFFQGNILNLILNEGNNKLEIRALNDINLVGKKNIILEFNVKIPFFKSTLFYVMVPFCILIFLFYFYYRSKLLKQQKYFEQQLLIDKERNKITVDLHDEIGSTLSSLQINTAIANQIIEKDINESKNILSKVENQSKSLSEKIGDIIWSMKPGKDEFMTLSIRIKNYCNEVLGSTNIKYLITVDPEIDNVITEFSARKNVLLIAKEAINNALKYSKASQINITIEIENNSVLLQISDNGIGFNPQEIKGNGIGNMKKRANDLNGILTIISNENCGTTIQLQFKLIP
jgi:signal transduction histidine kinase/ligand-binding sensor domain-containing protein